MSSLPFHSRMVADILKARSCLVVSGIGLGVENTIRELILKIAGEVKTGKGKRKSGRDLLFVLNCTNSEKDVLWKTLGKSVRVWDITASTFNSIDRRNIYDSSYQLTSEKIKVIFITMRILICDLLNEVLDVNKIKGFLVLHFEGLKKRNYVSFSLNVVYQKMYGKKKNEVKNKKKRAVVEHPLDYEFLENNYPLKSQKDEDVMSRIKKKELLIVAFSENCKKLMRNTTALTNLMESMFLDSFVLYPRMRNCVRKDLVHAPDVDESEIPLTSSMSIISNNLSSIITMTINKVKNLNKDFECNYNSLIFEKRFFNELRENHVKYKPLTMKYLKEIRTLRMLLYWLTFYDCVTFYNYIETLRFEAEEKNQSQNWMLTAEYEKIRLHTKKRVFSIESTFEYPQEKKQRTITQLERKSPLKRKAVSTVKWNLEENPKWKALTGVLETIEKLIGERKSDKGNNQVVIFVRSPKAETQVKQYLSMGARKMLFQVAKRIVSIQIQKKQQRYVTEHGKRSNSYPGRGGRSWFRKRGGEIFNREKRKIRNVNTENELKVLSDFFKDERKKETFEPVMPVKEEFLLNFEVLAPNVVGKKIKKGELSIIIYPLSDLERVFCSFKPCFFILYDYNLEVVRRIEVFKAMNKEEPVKVYILCYNKSCEYEKHLFKCKMVEESFTRLISFRKSSAMTKAKDLIENAITPSFELSQTDFVSSRKKGGQTKNDGIKKTIIVDNREFRSVLPICLNEKGYEVIPKQLLVGDYIVTRKLCVERKSLSDFVQSMISGRLYSQCLNMKNHYSEIALLIQFEEKRDCSLFAKAELLSKVTVNHLASKLVILLTNFPTLLVFWSKDSEDTAHLFDILKRNQAEPDLEIVEKVEELETEDEFRDNAFQILHKLPGVTENNVGKILDRCENLADLCTLPFDELKEVLGSQGAAKKFKSFITKGESGRKNNNRRFFRVKKKKSKK